MSATTMSLAPPLTPGERLAQGYTVLSHVGRGRLLDVYEVWSEARDCGCVAKLAIPELRGDERGREGLVREGELLQTLTHPHLVRAYETIAEPDPIIILELLSGATLQYVIDNATRRMAAMPIVYLGMHLCSAIGYLHGQGVLHLDLKPGNVVVGNDGRTRVIDLSLAGPPRHTRGGRGTPLYMAPEQVNAGWLDRPTDVWGIGMLLYEAAAGRPPFEYDRDDPPQLRGRVDSVRRYRRLPEPLAAAIDACLEPEPDRRPTIAALAELMRDLHRAHVARVR